MLAPPGKPYANCAQAGIGVVGNKWRIKRGGPASVAGRHTSGSLEVLDRNAICGAAARWPAIDEAGALKESDAEAMDSMRTLCAV
eukprot:7164113-Prymnesium_polylepis.2